MQRKVVLTADGSRTIHLEEWNENYHSRHGALQEAKHVFIQKVRDQLQGRSELSILEMGFGTGLNAFLTIQLALELKVNVKYVSLEAFPVQFSEIDELNYEAIWMDGKAMFTEMHAADWGVEIELDPLFRITKEQILFEQWLPIPNTFDFVYFDAFGPRVQPELWSISIFEKLYNALKSGGVFLTYCAKGQVRRDLIAVGFEMHRLEGPPGKREMLLGFKRMSS